MKLKDKTKIKITSLLYTIYTKCEMGVPFVLSDLITDLKMNGNTGPVIKQFELFERTKKVEGGHLCKWIKPAPDEKMIEAVVTAIREYTKAATKAKQTPKEVAAKPDETSTGKINEQLMFPNLPPNMPAPLQAVCNLIMDSMKQQNAYLKAMGVAVSDMQSKVDNLFAQLNS